MAKRFHTQILLLGLVSLFTDMASEMLYPVAPLYLGTVLGASMALIGVLEGIAEALAGLLKGWFGALSDARGRRAPFVRMGYGLSALAKPLPGLWASIGGVVMGRLVDRVGKAIRTAPRDALLAAWSDPGSRGSAFGFHRAMDTVGAAVGPLFALLWFSLRPGDYAGLFLAAIVPGLCAMALTWVVKDGETKTVPVRPAVFSHLRRAWKESPTEVRRLLTAIFVFTLFNSSDVFIILKARGVMGSDGAAIGVYIAYNLVYAALSWPGGMLADRLGMRRVYRWGMLLYAVAYGLFAVGDSGALIWVGAVVYGFYAAFTESVAKAWVAELTPAERRGSVFGLMTAGMSLGALLASVGAGVAWSLVGPALPFVLAATGALLSLLLLPTSSRRTA